MSDFLTPRQIALLKYAKKKKAIYLEDVKKFYTTQPQKQIVRLTELGYFKVCFGKFSYTGKGF